MGGALWNGMLLTRNKYTLNYPHLPQADKKRGPSLLSFVIPNPLMFANQSMSNQTSHKFHKLAEMTPQTTHKPTNIIIFYPQTHPAPFWSDQTPTRPSQDTPTPKFDVFHAKPMIFHAF